MNPIGFYYTCDDAYCDDCADKVDWPGFESWEEPIVIFRDTEGDTPTHCKRCEALIPHNLTPDGFNYLVENIGAGGRRCIERQWWQHYSKWIDVGEQKAIFARLLGELDVQSLIDGVVADWPESDEFSPREED